MPKLWPPTTYNPSPGEALEGFSQLSPAVSFVFILLLSVKHLSGGVKNWEYLYVAYVTY